MLPKVSAELFRLFDKRFSLTECSEEDYAKVFEIFDVLNQIGNPMRDRVVDLIFSLLSSKGDLSFLLRTVKELREEVQILADSRSK